MSFISAQQAAAQPLRYRGFMVGSNLTINQVDELYKDWKINLIRWQLVSPGQNIKTWDEYLAWLGGQLGRLDEFLTECDKYLKRNVKPGQRSIGVIVDLHNVPGGYKDGVGEGDEHSILTDRSGYDYWVGGFLHTWASIVAICKKHRCVVGYDLFNEPRGSDELWLELVEATTTLIRDNLQDKSSVIVVQNVGLDPSRIRHLMPLRSRLRTYKPIWFSVHVYDPLSFTHQGIDPHPKNVKYTDAIRGRVIERLRTARTEFSDKRFPVYVGEFSVSQFAASRDAAAYLNECIALFELYGWHWTYHAYAEAAVWTPERGGRAVILKDKFARNR